ncbi:MAG TPA: hypothetical protein PKJ41_08490 [Bryobacteraceae bacterium]|nr:hypothetical protein [Bryobacteraceae bacterium]
MQAAALKLSAIKTGSLVNSAAQVVPRPRETGEPTTKETGGLFAAASGNVPAVDTATQENMKVGEATSNGAPGANAADQVRLCGFAMCPSIRCKDAPPIS